MADDIKELLAAAKSKRLKLLKRRDWIRSEVAPGMNAESPILDGKIEAFDTLIQTLEEVARSG